jgi:hypothetical protein
MSERIRLNRVFYIFLNKGSKSRQGYLDLLNTKLTLIPMKKLLLIAGAMSLATLYAQKNGSTSHTNPSNYIQSNTSVTTENPVEEKSTNKVDQKADETITTTQPQLGEMPVTASPIEGGIISKKEGTNNNQQVIQQSDFDKMDKDEKDHILSHPELFIIE